MSSAVVAERRTLSLLKVAVSTLATAFCGSWRVIRDFVEQPAGNRTFPLNQPIEVYVVQNVSFVVVGF